MPQATNILYIDDSQLHLDAVRAALASAPQYRLSLAANLSEALSRVSLHTFDIVVVDYLMPGASGADILRAIKGHPNLAQARCFLYTTDRTAHVDYARLGFDGTFTNKGDTSSLLRQLDPVARMLQLKRLAKKARAS